MPAVDKEVLDLTQFKAVVSKCGSYPKVNTNDLQKHLAVLQKLPDANRVLCSVGDRLDADVLSQIQLNALVQELK